MEWMRCRTFLLVFTVFQWTYSSLLLVTVGSTNGSLTDAQMIKIIPLEAKACSGSTVTISCNYDSLNITNPRNVKVKWIFNETLVEGERYRQEKEDSPSILTIIEVTVNDSGWYVCEVTQDIPVLLTQRSNKSNLTVFDYSTTTESVTATSTTVCTTTTGPESNWLVWMASALGFAGLVTAIVVIWSIFRRRQEAPIYENTTARAQKNHPPRPRIPEEKGKMCKHTDTLKSHNYVRYPRAGQLNR